MSYLLHDTQQSILLLLLYYTSASCLVTFSKNNGSFVMVTGKCIKGSRNMLHAYRVIHEA